MLTAIDLEPFFTDLAEKHWAVLPTDRSLCEKLLKCAFQHDEKGRFKPAQISTAISARSEAIRNDRTYWLDADKNELESVERSTLEGLRRLTDDMKEFFRLPLREFECHYAIYEPGHYYHRHTDITNKENRRIFSFALYLNPQWQRQDGGELVAYSDTEKIFTITPEAGQLVLFKSELEHEVIKTNRTRYSLTGWIRR